MKNYLLNIIFAITISSWLLYSCVDEHFINVEEKTYTAKLVINSDPQGAKIFLQGTDTEKVTPDTLTNLEKGNYELMLKAADFIDTTFVVSVFDNIITSKEIKLKPEEFSGKIILESNPPNAKIYYDNIFQNKVTVDSITNLKYGMYYIQLKLQNYRDTTIIVELGKNEKVSTKIELVKYKPSGEILINSNPENAKIKFNNLETNLFTPASIKNLYEGTYSITLSQEGFADTTFIIALAKDEKFTKLIELKKLPSWGDLNINSIPIGANIFLQGNDTQFSSPHLFKNLIVGPYLITLKMEDFRDTSFIVNVIENQEIDVQASLTDTIQSVNAELKYELQNNNVMKFILDFNQNITLSQIDVFLPNSSSTLNFKYNDEELIKGNPIEITYDRKIRGIWRFQIIGNKMRGNKNSFDLIKQINVQ